jgi:hypothetical protein
VLLIVQSATTSADGSWFPEIDTPGGITAYATAAPHRKVGWGGDHAPHHWLDGLDLEHSSHPQAFPVGTIHISALTSHALHLA